MNRYGRIAAVCWAVAAAALAYMLMGCASTATVARMDGFNAQWRGFSSIPATPGLSREAEIRVKVIVVGDLGKIGYPGAAATYSHPQGIIRIIGKEVGGKIIIPEAVIGHEILHALEYQAGRFVNPDKLSEIGY